MKRLALGLVILLAVAAIGVVVFMRNIDSIIEGYRPQIEAVLSDAIKTPVKVGAISVKLFPSTRISIHNIALQSGSSNDARVGLISVDSSINTILSGKVSVNSIDIQDLKVTLTKTKDGSFQIGGINLAGNKQANTQKATSTSKTEPSNQDKKLAIAITQADIKNANISFVDESLSTPQRINLSDINIRLTEVSSDGKAKILAKASCFAKQKDNIAISGSLDLANFDLPKATINVKIEATALDLAAFKQLAVAYGTKLEALELAETVSLIAQINKESVGHSLTLKIDAQNSILKYGNLFQKLSSQPFAIESKSLIELSSDGKPSKVSTTSLAKLTANNSALNLELNPDYTQEAVKIKESKLACCGGALVFNGALGLVDQKLFNISAQGKSLSIESLSQTLAPSSNIAMTGQLDVINSKSEGSLLDPKQSLTNSTKLNITKGSIKGFNLLGQTLGSIKNIPGLSDALFAYAPDKFKPLLTSDSTAFDSLSLDLSIKNQTISINTITLNHSLYSISGKGSATFAGTFNINTQMKVSPTLTTDMVTKQQNLKLLLDESGYMVFPVIVKKDTGSVVVLPDTSELVQRAAKNTAKEATKKALEKAVPNLGGTSKLLDSLF